MTHFQSEAEFDAWLKAKGLTQKIEKGESEYEVEFLPGARKQDTYTTKMRGSTPLPQPRHSSRKIPKTERIYMRHLDLQQQAGLIVRYWHEPLKFILTHGIPGKVNEMSYKIDFLVQLPWHLRFVEVKANKQAEKEDSWVKLKAACEMFPCFEFVKVYVNTKTGELKEEILT
jgi:hypothetical protein